MTLEQANKINPHLKKCPFCGASGVEVHAMGEFWVRCSVCKAATEMESSLEKAIANWNRRDTVIRG